MIVVDRITRAVPPGHRLDKITMAWEDRRKAHGRRVSDGGIEFGLSLPPGSVLKEGDCLALDAIETTVQVREQAEPVFVVEPANEREWAFVAYQIGNRHQALMIGECELICLQDPAVRSLFDQIHVGYRAESRPFQPATVTTGHSH